MKKLPVEDGKGAVKVYLTKGDRDIFNKLVEARHFDTPGWEGIERDVLLGSLLGQSLRDYAASVAEQPKEAIV